MYDLHRYPEDTQYGCVAGKNPILVDLNKSPKGHLQKQYNYGLFSSPELYVADDGRAYYVVDTLNLDRGIKVLAGMETNAKDPAEAAAYEGLKILYQCEAKGDAECTQKAVADLKIKGAEAKQVAINQYVSEGNRYVSRAKEIIALSRVQDKGPGGIKPSDLVQIFNNHTDMFGTSYREYMNPTTVSDASSYAGYAMKMLGSLVLNKSGYKTIKERPDSGCTVSEYDTSPPSSCPSGETGDGGEERSVTCSDIGFSVTETLSSRGCSAPSSDPWPPEGYDNRW